MRQLNRLVIIVALVALLLPIGVMAQSDHPEPPPDASVTERQSLPTMPEGGSLYFLPSLMKAETTASPPVLMFLHAGMTMMKASTADSWCVNLLASGVIQSASDFCLLGTLYPVLLNKDVAVSAAGWDKDNQAIVVQGPALNVTSPPIFDKKLLLGNVLLEAGEPFPWGKNEELTVVPINLSSGVTAASVNQEVAIDVVELLKRVNRIKPNQRIFFGVKIPITFTVYDWSGTYPTSLSARCTMEELEGEDGWPWLPTVVMMGGDAPLIAGEWGFNTHDAGPDGLWTVRRRMDIFRFVKWGQITQDPVFADFRVAVMSSSLLADPVPVRRYEVPSWGDSEKGGNWYIQIFPAAAGAVVVAAQYMQEIGGVLEPVAGFLNSAWLIIPDPKSKIMCGIMNDPTICALGTIQ